LLYRPDVSENVWWSITYRDVELKIRRIRCDFGERIRAVGF
jgi:hypothetical protein